MASVNRVTLVGNLGRDPELKTFPSGDQVANVTIATTDKWKDKQTGEMKEATEWHRITFNGRLAEIAGQYLRKGSQIYVEGSLRTRKWTDQAGVEKYSTEIRADQMQMLGSRQGGDQGDSGDGYAPAPRPQQRQAPAPRPAPAMDFPENPSYRAAPRSAPPPQSGGSGFDDLDGGDIPFRDPLSYRGAHLVL